MSNWVCVDTCNKFLEHYSPLLDIEITRKVCNLSSGIHYWPKTKRKYFNKFSSSLGKVISNAAKLFFPSRRKWSQERSKESVQENLKEQFWFGKQILLHMNTNKHKGFFFSSHSFDCWSPSEASLEKNCEFGDFNDFGRNLLKSPSLSYCQCCLQWRNPARTSRVRCRTAEALEERLKSLRPSLRFCWPSLIHPNSSLLAHKHKLIVFMQRCQSNCFCATFLSGRNSFDFCVKFIANNLNSYAVQESPLHNITFCYF